MAAAGLAFACISNLLFLVIGGTIGVISLSGNEVGPFLSIEQAALPHIVSSAARTEVFAWYTLAGSLAAALGALFGGGLTQALQHTSMSHIQSYRAVAFLYAALGVALAFLFLSLLASVEVSPVSNGAVASSALANILATQSSAFWSPLLEDSCNLPAFAIVSGIVCQRRSCERCTSKDC